MKELNDLLRNVQNKQKPLRKSLLKLAAETLISELQAFTLEAHRLMTENRKDSQSVGQRGAIRDYQSTIGLYDSTLENVVIAVREEILDELNLEYAGEIYLAFSDIHTNTQSADHVIGKVNAMIEQFAKFAQQLGVPKFA
ncbi:hypothetical protein [Spirosoma agri]|uniref:Uncharacterized protein n=1 Tax=Spirosoma agri TaxID=1987381 RepID=A0A6M0IIT5_9BACT|nr:hypothetical protein [Spirosoma agri]NEU67767.1 hypothetical protein [Spirosoma agri]